MNLALLFLLAADSELATNRELLRTAFQRMTVHDKALDDHLYERNSIKKEFDSSGKLKLTLNQTFRRDPWDEFMVTRLIARDGKPLPPEEVTKQEARLAKYVSGLRDGKSPPANPRDDLNSWLTELPEALDFRKISSDVRDGRATDLYEFSPHPGYKAKNIRARAFEKVRGKVWLDQAENEIAKLDTEIFDTVYIGFGVLGKIEKGSHFEFERRRATDKHWFYTWQRARFDVKVMLVKTIKQEFEARWYNIGNRPSATYPKTTGPPTREGQVD